MIKKYLALIVFLILIFSLESNAQFNFFVGADSDQLKPTVKGFGSITFPSIMINKSYIDESGSGKFNKFYSVNFGFSWKMWRFADNVAFIKETDGSISIASPGDANFPAGESYTDGFFSYTKSKLSTGVIRIRPEFGLTTKNKNFSFGTGPLIEITVAAKDKRKYYDDAGGKQKSVTKGISYHNLNWFQFGWGASVGTYHFGAFAYYMLTPQFKKNLGPNVHAAEVGLYWRVLRYAKSSKAPTEKFSQL